MDVYQQLFDKLEKTDRLARQRLAFMPAALEIERSPPTPIGRAIVWVIVILFSTAVAWAMLGKIDIVAVAPGKVIPSGKTKTIQPFDRGTIQAIHVVEGQSVVAGDPLISLDPTAADANERQASRDLRSAQSELVRELALNRYLNSATATFDGQSAIGEAAREKGIAMTRRELDFQGRLLEAQVAELRSRLSSLSSDLLARQAEKRAAALLAEKYQRILPITTERVNAVAKLYEQKLAARSEYLELEQQRIDQQQNLAAERARIDELTAAVATIAARIEAARHEALKANLSALEEAERQSVSLRQEHAKARQKSRQHVLLSPIDGTVQELAVHTVGGVVTPAQQLMHIVPSNDTVEVEAFLQNKDIGFVSERQGAEVKVDAFNFTRYGTIDSTVRTISDDAVNDETMGLVYPARVELARDRMRVNQQWMKLSPGMTVTVEIKTGKRRIIEFFLSPLLRYQDESLKER